jgi:hypothetical protein
MQKNTVSSEQQLLEYFNSKLPVQQSKHEQHVCLSFFVYEESPEGVL